MWQHALTDCCAWTGAWQERPMTTSPPLKIQFTHIEDSHVPRRAACSESLKPNLVVGSGSTVIVEMITHHAGDDPDK
jgi:hypothetical protein